MTEVHVWAEFAVNLGQAPAVRDIVARMCEAASDEEPGLRTYRWFFDAEETVCHTYECFVDSDAVVAHGRGRAVGEGIPALLGVSTFTRFEVHGELSAEAREMFASMPFATLFSPFDGFTRTG